MSFGTSPIVTSIRLWLPSEYVKGQSERSGCGKACEWRGSLRVGSWQNGFSRMFIFGPPDFLADFFSSFLWGKMPGKSSRKIPGKILQNLYNKNPRHISVEGPGKEISEPFARERRKVDGVRDAPDTWKVLRHVMRALCLYDQSALTDASLGRKPLKNLRKSSRLRPKDQPSKSLWERNALNISRFKLFRAIS